MSLSNYLVGSQVVLVFERDSEVRKRVFYYEDRLSSFFKTPFLILPVPDEADGNIPRFESESLNGYSRIQVSQFRTAFFTRYSDDYRKNIKAVRKYINDRVDLLKEVVNKVHQIKYVGFIFDVFIEFDEREINSFLKNITKFNALSPETIDFSVRYSVPYKSRYFLNINVSKSRQDEIELDPKGRIIGKTEKYIHGISAITDINSKLLHQKGEKFNFNVIADLEEEIFTLVKNNNLENYLTGEIA